jgi:signal transduction histidine kinase
MRLRARPSGPLLLAGVLAALLLMLASLQWRWLGQISADERDRMQASLRSQVGQFTQEFDRELTRAYFWLQADRGPNVTAADSVGHFQRWFSTAPQPELVRAIHVVSVPHGQAERGTVEVSSYDRQREVLVPQAGVPAELAAIVARLAARPAPTDGRRGDGRFGDGRSGGPSSGPGGAFVPPLDPEGPALVIPRPPVPIVNAGGAIVFSQEQRPWDYTVVLLDTTFIRETFVPELLKRHFGEGTSSAYRVSIVDRRTGAPVFCSDGSGDRCVIPRPDASEDFFEIRMREFNRFVVVDDRRGQPGRPAVVAGSAAATTAPLPPDGPRERVTMNVVRGGPDGDQRRDRQPLWRADFAHQAGSLEAVVASTRRRNLLVSTSVLALLGASIAMLVVSSTRARRLAAQQMEFVAGVSHELRTPLAVIRSAAENLADGVVHDRDQVQRYGQLIAGEGRRLTEMVEQVMEFAGFDAGRTLDTRPVAALDVAQAAIEASGPLLAASDTHVDIDVPDTPVLVQANAAALARSVQNLISNAVKYGGEDRWVGVRVAPADGRLVAIAVSDHGTGIAEPDLARIFEPFYRGQHAADGHVPGSGLGLSLVDRIVRQHGGRVEVQSGPKGTTFRLLIPAASAAAVSVEEVVSAEAGLDRRGVTS